MTEMLFTTLNPGTALTAEQLLANVDLGALAPAQRPYVVLNMVATADGRAAVAGRAGPIGDEADRQLFHQLRATADAVLMGARTASIERSQRLVRDPALRESRRRRGLKPDPVACIVSGRLNVAADIPLLQDNHSHVVIATGARGRLDGARAQVEYLRCASDLFELASVLGTLRSDYGVRSVVCEGGPTLNSTLFREGLIDELFLTVASKLAGGPDALTIVSGLPLAEIVELELVWSLRSGDDLFLRYRVASARANA
ncbi:MAG: dihydrofolate reductase family protein [Pseudonocardiales bacterium]|nr:dihydrofolate reductase family protein [Pseudonocardiales bacterium]MBV9031447.1 dihydrofolate reductase family protein [Pseudonocardiales bacterium]